MHFVFIQLATGGESCTGGSISTGGCSCTSDATDTWITFLPLAKVYTWQNTCARNFLVSGISTEKKSFRLDGCDPCIGTNYFR